MEINQDTGEQATEEKLKNMSPEELATYQKGQCIFCQITSGKVASKKVYEDEHVLAILDINPANPGHILLLPKEHYPIMPIMPEDEIAHIFTIAKHLSSAILRALKVDGTNIFVANGALAGQKAQHFMVHVIPRRENDGVGFEINEKEINPSDQEQVYDRLIDRICEVFNLPKPEKKISKIEKEIKSEPKKPEKKEKSTIKEKKDVSLDDISSLLRGSS